MDWEEPTALFGFKRKQGYIVNLVTVGSGGTVANTTTAITSYMQGLWNSATSENPAPTYLIIVGDTSTKTIEQSDLGQYCDVLNAQKWGLSDKSGEFGRFCPKTPFWSPHISSFFRFS